MANTITKPDANPLVAALLTWFVIGIGHMVINGQQRKWIYTLIASIIGSILCVLPGVVIAFLSVYESYLTAQHLQNGETIGENEYFQPLLFKVVSIIDKEATCKQA